MLLDSAQAAFAHRPRAGRRSAGPGGLAPDDLYEPVMREAQLGKIIGGARLERVHCKKLVAAGCEQNDRWTILATLEHLQPIKGGLAADRIAEKHDIHRAEGKRVWKPPGSGRLILVDQRVRPFHLKVIPQHR